VFGCKEVGGSKEMGSIIAHFPIYPDTGKENEKIPFSFSLFPFTQLLPHFQGATVNFVVL